MVDDGRDDDAGSSDESLFDIVKALEEVSETTDALTRAVSSLTKFDKALEQLTGRNFRYYRDWLRLYFTKRDVKPVQDHISSKEKIALLENAVRETDPTIRELWRALMANSFDPEIRMRPKVIFSSILSSMEGADARLLLFLKCAVGRNGSIAITDLAQKLNYTELEVELSLHNLERLRCLKYNDFSSGRYYDENPNFDHRPRAITQKFSDGSASIFYEMTKLSCYLLDACSNDHAPAEQVRSAD